MFWNVMSITSLRDNHVLHMGHKVNEHVCFARASLKLYYAKSYFRSHGDNA